MKFNYDSCDTVVSLMEKNDFMSIIDISDAYRVMPIHPHDRVWQGLCWKFKNNNEVTYIQDNCLWMGLSSRAPGKLHGCLPTWMSATLLACLYVCIMYACMYVCITACLYHCMHSWLSLPACLSVFLFACLSVWHDICGRFAMHDAGAEMLHNRYYNRWASLFTMNNLKKEVVPNWCLLKALFFNTLFKLCFM